jgi:ferredoxin
MKVVVDFDLCQGHGVCAGEAPEVFRLDERTGQLAILQERPPEALREAVLAAVKYCPTHALRIVEEV